jgi:hypothetical protein
VLLPTVLANAGEAEGSTDSRIISGSESVVPVSVEAGEVVVDVSINGRGPFPLIFDTGADDAVTPEMAFDLADAEEGGQGRRHDQCSANPEQPRYDATNDPKTLLEVPHRVAERRRRDAETRRRHPEAGGSSWDDALATTGFSASMNKYCP